MTNTQMLAYGAIAGAIVVALLWWSFTRRKPDAASLADTARTDAEWLRESALQRAETAQLQAEQERATARMYERRIERLSR